MKAPKEGITPEWIRAKFVDVSMASPGQRWRVMKSGKHRDKIGDIVATIGLRHAPGYEVVLKFEDGTIESFAPNALCPPPPQSNESES